MPKTPLNTGLSPPPIDYAEAGRLLLSRVNLQSGLAPQRYAPFNVIYQHPETGGKVYVGNATAASNRKVLDEMGGCRRIVFCQDGDGSKHFEEDPEFRYLTFPIGRWRSHINRKPNEVLNFFTPLFNFLDAELSEGQNILIHCLAGAHRAGTAGIASLMYLCEMDKEEATDAAKKLRPAINPIGDFPVLLELLERGMERDGRGT